MPAESQSRCRFAPSPTGYLHVGSAHSALFNWLFAKSTGAEMLLRIEDTDAERNRPELTENILAMLRWLEIDWSGDPVIQSENRARHLSTAHRLAETGRAYWCDCSTEDVDARFEARGERRTGYDGYCRDRGLEPAPGRALRFRTPTEGETAWRDIVRGEIRTENRHLDDFVIVRSNGAPLFIVGNVVDDADMGITHVIRGEDHVSNTPKYILLWTAMEVGPLPQFAHLPLLVNEQRKKLSKRRDPVSVEEFKDRGYLPEAMRNYLALLGWGPRDGVEVRPIEEIVALFRLEDVSPSPAFFDVQKLTHINGDHIRRLAPTDFVERATPFLPADPRAHEALLKLAPLVQERARTLAEVPELLAFLWEDPPERDEAAWQKAIRDDRGVQMLRFVVEAFDDIPWNAEAIEAAVRDSAVRAGFVRPDGTAQLSKAQAPVRVAITGRSVGLPLWESIVALGHDRAVERQRSALADAESRGSG